MSEHTGGCLCGAVRYRIDEPVKFSSLCHCRSCQRATGAPVAAFVGLDAARFAETGGRRAIHESSPGVRRGFCASCGTSLTYEGDAWPGEVHVYTATLDVPAAFPPSMHSMTADAIPWLRMADDLPRRRGFATGKRD